MGLKEEIDLAITAHNRWKKRLRDAIAGQDIAFDIDKAGTDNNCDFGKWIYGDSLTVEIKQSEYYKKVKELHAEFHKLVKKVVELVQAGKKDEAEKMLSIAGDYSKVSSKLILILAEWDRSVK
jgi:hypothetical protein